MCKYVLLEEKLCAQDFSNEVLTLEIIHTECGYLVNKSHVEHQLARGKDRCEFCNEVIEYAN